MAEPQPNDFTEGPEQAESLPANAEDRKAARALNSLDTKGDDETPKKELDLKALSDAMKNLGVDSQEKKPASKKDDTPKKPLIKVDPAHVTLLAEQLDMSKVKATELLRAHDADAKKAMLAWVTVSP